jgi:hypothetical protein
MLVTVLSTGDLTPAQRSSVIDVCIAAHNNPAFSNLFNNVKSGGRHCLAYRGRELVSHAVVTTRWVQPEGLSILISTPQQRGVMVLRLPQTPSLDLEIQLTIECQPYRIWE